MSAEGSIGDAELADLVDRKLLTSKSNRRGDKSWIAC